MTEGRCDLILLGWTAFVGFHLVSDFLWNSSSAQGHEASTLGNSLSVSALGTPGSALLRGTYRLDGNSSGQTEQSRVPTEEGTLVMKLVTQQTSVESVRISSISMALLKESGNRNFASSQSDFDFRGMAFGNAGELTATGHADPHRFPQFGPKPCRADAVVSRSHGKPGDESLHLNSDALGFFAEGGGSVVGRVEAVDCGFSVGFSAKTVDIGVLTQKVVHYSIWVNLLTIMQIRCFLIQMRHTEDGPSAAKVSILCIAIQAMMDAYDAFLHLCLGLSLQYMFNTIAVVSLFKFILFSLLETRYLLTIWRQRRSDAFNQGWETVRRELSWLYSRFYGVLIIGMVLIYNNLQNLHLIALGFQAFWLPQIFQDAWQGSRSALRPGFITGIAVTRTLSMLYLWGCPEERIFGQDLCIFSDDLYPRLPHSPSLKMCAGFVLVQVVQVAVMMLQKSWGPRWFVPRICLPQAYNYYRKVRMDDGTECVICMSEIDIEDARRVITPCNHNFHRACLDQWMDVKMECPTCRMALPPL